MSLGLCSLDNTNLYATTSGHGISSVSEGLAFLIVLLIETSVDAKYILVEW